MPLSRPAPPDPLAGRLVQAGLVVALGFLAFLGGWLLVMSAAEQAGLADAAPPTAKSDSRSGEAP